MLVPSGREEQPSLTPYSRTGPPQLPQNSRCKSVPDPLSATCSFVLPCVTVNELFGTLVVTPNGPPVNFWKDKRNPSMPRISKNMCGLPNTYLAILTMTQRSPRIIRWGEIELVFDIAAITGAFVNHRAGWYEWRSEMCKPKEVERWRRQVTSWGGEDGATFLLLLSTWQIKWKKYKLKIKEIIFWGGIKNWGTGTRRP